MTSIHHLLLWSFLAFAASVAVLSEAGAMALADDDIVVLEQGYPGTPALIRVDPATGDQQVISSGGLLSQGIPSGFAYDRPTGSFFVVTRLPSSLIRIDPVTGEQSLITSFPLAVTTGIAIEANGDFLVTDYGGFSIYDARGRLLRVSRDGSSTAVLAQGGFLDFAAWAVQIDRSGNPIVSGFGSGVSRIIRVDPRTGEQHLLASTSTGSFYDFALDGRTAYVALSSLGYPNSMDRVVTLDLESGEMTTLFDGLQRVLDVDIDAQGRLVVLDQCRSLSPCAGSPVVYRSNSSGGLDVVSENEFMFVPGRLTLVHTRFDFRGFLHPVLNPPVVNRVKAGSTVPIRFSLGGDQGRDVLAEGSPSVRSVPCDASAPVNDIEGLVTKHPASLRYAPKRDRYTYLWKTDKRWAGTCQELALELIDGSVHQATFRFERQHRPHERRSGGR